MSEAVLIQSLFQNLLNYLNNYEFNLKVQVFYPSKYSKMIWFGLDKAILDKQCINIYYYDGILNQIREKYGFKN